MYKDCATCHGIGKIKPFPEGHASFPADSCTSCHKPAGDTGTPTAGGTPAAGGPAAIPHPIEGDAYKDCTTCHGIGKLRPFPENHTAFKIDQCTSCHKPAASGGATGGTGSTGGGTTAAAPIIPASHDLSNVLIKDCIQCHGANGLKPFPASHASFTVETCQTCHKQAQ
jgi:hypothetical protein